MDSHQPPPPSPRAAFDLRWFIRLTLLMASVQFIRCYIIQTYKFLDLPQYAAGLERMPFQGRMLMMFPLRWAQHSPLLLRLTSGPAPLFSSPDDLVISVIGFLSVLITGVLITKLYRRVSPDALFPWMPYALMLVFLASNYLLHSPLIILYPYDLPSVAFFTAGVYCIYTRRFWALLPVFMLGCFNRETMLFLIPLFIIDAVVEGERDSWKHLKKISTLAQIATLGAVWLAIHLYIQHRFRGNHGEFYPQTWDPAATHRRLNLLYLLEPKFWPQLLNACAYTLPFLLLLRRYILPLRLRAYVVVLPLWAATMAVFGLWPETRIYGELSGLAALLATLLLEGYITRRLQPEVPPKAVPTA
jgi:hypothetical protein